MYDLRIVSDGMPDPLLLSESLLCWQLANYAFFTDPVKEDWGARAAKEHARRNWFAGVLLRSVAAALLLACAGGFKGGQMPLSAVVLMGSLLLPWIRGLVRVRYLVEFELAVNGLLVLFLWITASRWSSGAASLWWAPLDVNKTSVILIGAAVLIYMVRGGSYLVRGILKKAGGLPDEDEPRFETSEGYAHGRMIGQIERIIVVLIVMGGNLGALAFFFAAKGLIRSKELEKRSQADYFLLGSLASFLIALAAGLILQKTIAALWY
jgi:hypothetical protein